MTDLKSEFKCAKNTCQTMLVMNKKYVFKDAFIVQDFKIVQSVLKSKYYLLFNCRCHKIPEEKMIHDDVFQLPTSQAFLAIGSFESGLQGKPNGGLQTCHCYRHIHPWHKYLEWFPQELDQLILWVILDLKNQEKEDFS